MIESSRLRLRDWIETDLPVMMQLRNDVELNQKLLSQVRGSDLAQVRSWISEKTSGPSSILFVIAEKSSNRALGYLQFVNIQSAERSGDLGICFSPQASGKGFGQEALNLAIEYFRQSKRLLKLSLRVSTDNLAAIHCYQKVGFQQIALLPHDISINGVWKDILLMEQIIGSGG